MTEILLDLLFDISLAGATVTAEDVRDLTRPLAELAEGSEGDDGYRELPLVRFVWGKAWNVLGVVAALAERLEQFTPEGTPQRSWLRMRFLRTGDTADNASDKQTSDLPLSDLPESLDIPPDQLRVYQVEGADDAGDGQPDTKRVDEIAALHYGNPAWWRLIAAFNNIDNPWNLKVGSNLTIPPASSLGAGA